MAGYTPTECILSGQYFHSNLPSNQMETSTTITADCTSAEPRLGMYHGGSVASSAYDHIADAVSLLAARLEQLQRLCKIPQLDPAQLIPY